MFKTILVHMRGTKADEAVLTATLQVARLSNAHLDCVHIRPNLGGLISRMAFDMDEDSDRMSESLALLRKLAEKTSRKAAGTFAAFCRAENIADVDVPAAADRVSATLKDTVDDELHYLQTQARNHDLVAIRAADKVGGLSKDVAGRLILTAGSPVLLAPAAPAQPIRTVVVAWKNSPEAARAIGAAIPIVASAEKVILLSASEDDEESADFDSIVTRLRWHGVQAEPHYIRARGRDVGDAVLESARAVEADLMIMGAYGHSRVNELVFGGFTEQILEDASLPVLLFH